MRTQSDKNELDPICSAIMVTPIDSEKLAKKVSQYVIEARPDLKDKNFEMANKYALSPCGRFLLDDECCANSGDSFSMAIRRSKEVTKVSEDGKETSWQMFSFAVWDFEATKEELQDYLLEPVDLKTFMGQRYCYNPRIVSNTRILIKAMRK